MTTPLIAVVFDLDDTLFPERQYAESGLTDVGSYLEQICGISGVVETLVGLLREGRRGDIIDAGLARHGLDPALTPSLVERYRSHSPRIALFPETPAALGAVRARCRLGLLTDGPAVSQRLKIQALGLEEAFEAIVINDEHGRATWKPSPAGYRRIMRLLAASDVDGPRFCYVGDNPVKDFLGARGLGWQTIRVAHRQRLNPVEPPTEDHEADRVVDSLGAVVKALFSGKQ
jgi:putative hydrolase of the HAD superfamily